MWKPDQLTPWLDALERGHIAAAAAEGVYGYVADALDDNALNRLLETKKRESSKGLIVLIPELESLKYLTPLPLDALTEIATQLHWGPAAEHPTTLLLPAKPGLSPLLTGGQPTIAVRLPQVAYMQHYLQAWKETSTHGLLVSSSLNESGQSPVVKAEDISAETPALTLDNPLSGTPSRIFNPATATWLR